MKIFFYALREYDEKKYVEKFAEQYSFEYGFTSDYPSMDNVELAEGYYTSGIWLHQLSFVNSTCLVKLIEEL